MKLVTGLLAAVLLLAGVGVSHAVVRIADDRGGRIGTYVDKYQGLRTSGETVIIDGLCASACTIILGAVPSNRICVTSRATLGFHAAWDVGAHGRAVTNREATCGACGRKIGPGEDCHLRRGADFREFRCTDCGAPAAAPPPPPNPAG